MDKKNNLKIFKSIWNTIEEWKNVNFTNPQGKNTNIIITSHSTDIVGGGTPLIESYMNRGYILNQDDHNHPWNYERGRLVSGDYGETAGYGTGDRGTKQVLQNYETPRNSGNSPGKNAKFRMYWRGTYYPY